MRNFGVAALLAAAILRPGVSAPRVSTPATVPAADVSTPERAAEGSSADRTSTLAALPATTIVTGRLVDVGGFPIAPIHEVYGALRVKEDGEAPGRRDPGMWSYLKSEGRFAVEVPAGPRSARLIVSMVYVLDAEDSDLDVLVAERELPFLIDGAPVADLGDVALPEHPRLGSFEAGVESASGAPIHINGIHLAGRSASGRPLTLANRIGMNHERNAPQGYHADARFAVGLLPAGDYTLWIGAEGHETLRTTISITAGQARQGGPLHLRPTRLELRGQAVDAASGLPIEGANLVLSEKELEPGADQIVYGEWGESGKDGAFGLPLTGLPSCGMLELSASKEGYERIRIEVPVAAFSAASFVHRLLRLPALPPEE